MFSKKECTYRTVNIEAINEIDFRSIHPDIKHSDSWQECYPARTRIDVPIASEREIIEMLKKDKNITRVNGELTQKGIEAKNQVEDQFRSLISRTLQRN